MNELQVVTPEDRVKQLMSTIFNRGAIEQKVSIEYYTDEVIALSERLQQIYQKQIEKGEFDVDVLIDTLQSMDEEVLYKIAEIYASNMDSLKFYSYVKDESYSDMIDEIVRDIMIDEEIALFSAFPPMSKNNISYLITWSLDCMKAAYYIAYPPPGSFQEYCREIACEVYYNDAQNILIDECAILDNFDDSVLNIVRKPKEKPVVLEAKE